MGGCAADAASSWLGHLPERVGAWRARPGSRLARAEKGVAGPLAASHGHRPRGGGGAGVGPGKRLLPLQRPAAPPPRLPGCRQPAVPRGRRRGQAAQPLAGWSCRPTRDVAEEPQKRTSSAAEPTSAQRFLGSRGPGAQSLSLFGVQCPSRTL